MWKQNNKQKFLKNSIEHNKKSSVTAVKLRQNDYKAYRLPCEVKLVVYAKVVFCCPLVVWMNGVGDGVVVVIVAVVKFVFSSQEVVVFSSAVNQG